MSNDLNSTGQGGIGRDDVTQGSSGQGSSGQGSAATGSVGMSGGSSGSVASAPLGDGSTAASLVSNVRAGDEQFLFGDDRAITNPPNWHSQRSTELYNGATMNNAPSSAESDGQDWVAQSMQLKEIADDLYNAIVELGAAWVGHGASAAQGALVGIAKSGAQAGSAARTMGERMSQQAEAAAEVKKMPPPEEFDPEQATKAILAGGPAAMAADLKAQRDAADAVKKEQVRYFNAYTAAMQQVDGSTPSFGPESLGLKPMSGNGASTAESVGSLGAAPVGAVQAGSAAGVTPAGASAAPSGSGSGSVVATGSGESAQGGVETVESSSAGPAESGAGGSASPVPSTPPTTSAGGSAAFGGAALGGGLGLAGASLAAGKQSGAVREKQDASDEQDETGEVDAATEEETDVAAGESGGASWGGSGLPSSGGSHGDSGAPMTGAPMAGAAGAGRGGGSGEQHTHASFLVEPDPDDTFGAGQATAPPVIGEWLDDEAGS